MHSTLRYTPNDSHEACPQIVYPNSGWGVAAVEVEKDAFESDALHAKPFPIGESAIVNAELPGDGKILSFKTRLPFRRTVEAYQLSHLPLAEGE